MKTICDNVGESPHAHSESAGTVKWQVKHWIWAVVWSWLSFTGSQWYDVDAWDKNALNVANIERDSEKSG